MQVQIEIFADGPTRIVRCSDTDTASALEGTVVSTMRRIHDAEHRLLVTNQRFAALRGGAGISRLDLFGAAERRAGMLFISSYFSSMHFYFAFVRKGKASQ